MSVSTNENKSAGSRVSSFPRFIIFAIVGFSLTTLAVFYLSGRVKPVSEKRFAISKKARVLPDGTFQITIDARTTGHWTGADLGAGREIAASPKADLFVKRHFIRAPAGALDLGDVKLAEAKLPPEPKWAQDARIKGEQQNQALSDWYDYSSMTHVLKAKKRTYAIRLVAGGIAYFRIVSYYCDPEGSACLTLHYRIEHTKKETT